jgi:hypothetical protein
VPVPPKSLHGAPRLVAFLKLARAPHEPSLKHAHVRGPVAPRQLAHARHDVLRPQAVIKREVRPLEAQLAFALAEAVGEETVVRTAVDGSSKADAVGQSDETAAGVVLELARSMHRVAAHLHSFRSKGAIHNGSQRGC